MICQFLVSLKHENMIFEKQNFCFYVKKVEIVPEFEMLGRLGWFSRTEKKLKENTVEISDSLKHNCF